MAFGKPIVAILRLGMLCNSFIDRRFHVNVLDAGGAHLCILINTQLLLHLLEDCVVSITLIRIPGPWFFGLFFEVLNLPECALDIHDISGDSVEMIEIWIVVCSVDIVIVLAVPSDVVQWVLHLTNHCIGIAVTFCLAISVA